MKPLLTALLLSTVSTYAGDFVSLFDGKTLIGWHAPDGKAPGAGWVFDQGTLHLNGTPGGMLLSDKEYSQFELEWDWKVEEGGNNGVKYWSTKVGGKEWLGIEYQMIDDDKHPDGLKGGSHNTGSIYDIIDSAKDKAKKPIGEWNQSRIVVKDGKIEHFLNGKLSSSADTKSDEWKAAVAKSKFKNKKGFGPGQGKLMLTEHGDPCWFRNIVVTEL